MKHEEDYRKGYEASVLIRMFRTWARDVPIQRVCTRGGPLVSLSSYIYRFESGCIVDCTPLKKKRKKAYDTHSYNESYHTQLAPFLPALCSFPLAPTTPRASTHIHHAGIPLDLIGDACFVPLLCLSLELYMQQVNPKNIRQLQVVYYTTLYVESIRRALTAAFFLMAVTF